MQREDQITNLQTDLREVKDHVDNRDKQLQKLTFDLSSGVNKLMAISVVYIYINYVCWIIMNTFMYFQILQMEANEKRKAQQMSQLGGTQMGTLL